MRIFSISISISVLDTLYLPIFRSLILVSSTYSRLSLYFGILRLPPSQIRRLFSSSNPFLVSPSRRNPLCLSFSCLPTSFSALQFASARIHMNATRIPGESTRTHARTYARTHTNTYVHVRLMKSTNTSRYEWLAHASERDRVTRVYHVYCVTDLIGLYCKLNLRRVWLNL